jgi:hypothetical protein
MNSGAMLISNNELKPEYMFPVVYFMKTTMAETAIINSSWHGGLLESRE